MAKQTIPIQRVQTGVRLERSLVKVLKGLAEYLEISLGDLLEGIVLHAFDGKTPFDPDGVTAKTIGELKKIYGLDFDSSHSHRFFEQNKEGKAHADK